MADLDSLIGCKISLISHQDIRYDGNLFSINQSESSIVLKDVQVFGTEDRITDPAKVVAASPAVIPFVTFPGPEIKDLYVHETSSEPAPPAPPAAENKKSSADHKPARNQNNNNNQHRQQKTESAHPPNPPTAAEERKPRQEHHNNNNNQSQQRDNNYNRTNAGTGSHLLKMRERKAHGNEGISGASAGEVSKTEFNFEESLNKFQKEEVLKSVATGESAPPAAKKYVKDDFFDSISNDASGKEVGKTRLTASEERQLNQDTFGAIALQSNYRRGPYRGGGGRGGGRGRGGGQGYNNNNNGGNFGRGGRGRGGSGGGRGGNYRSNNNNNRAAAAEK